MTDRLKFFPISFGLLVLKLVICEYSLTSALEDPKLPSILELVPSQTGYEAVIEIVLNQHLYASVKENFHADTGHNHILLEREGLKSLDFYYETGELFLISDENCYLFLDSFAQYSARLMFENDFALFASRSLLKLTDIGPTGFWLGPLKNAEFNYTSDDVTENWYHKKDNFSVEFSFSKTSHLPLYSRIRFNDQDYHINFLSFKPRIETTQFIEFPYGYDCKRSVKLKKPIFPKFAQSSSHNKDRNFQYRLELEATYSGSYWGKDEIFTDRAILNFAENIYSVEMGDDEDDDRTIRVVYDGNVFVLYTIDLINGTCEEKVARTKAYWNYQDMPISWPIRTSKYFSLLEQNFWQHDPTDEYYYFGQTLIEGRVCDVFKKLVEGSNGKDFWAIYFFEATSTIDKAPVKVLVNKKKGYTDSNSFTAEINLVYTESPTDSYGSFDVSTCYETSKRYLWFQMSFTDRFEKILSLVRHEIEIENYFRKNMHDWFEIPRTRVSEIRTAFLGPSVYVTAKLLERPKLEFLTYKFAQNNLVNPKQVSLRESLEDCGELCIKTRTNCFFSYCQDLRCMVYATDSELDHPSIIINSKCDTFRFRPFLKKNPSIFYEMSAQDVFKHIKDGLKATYLEVDRTRVFADDVYIINAPNDIGRPEELEDPSSSSAIEQDYQIFSQSSKITKQHSIEFYVGLTYKECLKVCEDNDACQSISYCPTDGHRCVISSLNSSQINSSTIQSNADCNVFVKNYLAYYWQLPGLSALDTNIELEFSLTKEECAKKCFQEESIDCQSFDVCEKLLAKFPDEKSESTCFLHSHHLNKLPTAKPIDNLISIGNLTKCTHFLKKLSREFEQHNHERLIDKTLPIFLVGKTLQHCASECSDKNCMSFEFCESNSEHIGLSPSTCRISNTLRVEKTTVTKTNASYCSVYQSKTSLSRQETSETSRPNFVLAFGLGACFYVLALISGAVTFYLLKEKIFR